MNPNDVPLNKPGSTNGAEDHSATNEIGHKVSRREFVTTMGAITGGVALRLPKITMADSAHPVSDQASEALAGDVVPVKILINGMPHEFALDPRVTLLDLLREVVGLTGTKKGCDHGQCGARTVLVNNVRMNSCLTLAVMHDGDEITTVEGLSSGGQLHPLQQSFLEHDGLQCGYCTPGQICSGVALLREAENGDASVVTQDLTITGPAHLTDAEIRERMSGNICRCGAYPGILQAVSDYTRLGPKARNSG